MGNWDAGDGDEEEVVVNKAELAHVWRVAAWCAEVAAKLNLPLEECEGLEGAAMWHQQPELLSNESAWERLRADLGLGKEYGLRIEAGETAAVAVLRAFHGDHAGVPEKIRELAMILTQCDDVDNAYELDARVSPQSGMLDAVIEELGGYLRCVTRDEVESAQLSLPVFPAVAVKVFELLGDEKLTTLAELEEVIGSSIALAGQIVAVANSAAFGTAARVSNIGQAVARLGTALTRQVVCATALRSVFEPTVSHTLWNHSLAMAETAAGTATRSGRVETGKAFLAGLVHDVGKLVILQLDGKAREIYERLTRKGCPETVIEQVVFGQSHAAIGALVLTKWHFDESIVAAVEHHHEPQRAQSALCGILYLCENQHDGVATVRSEWREELARSCAGLPEKNDVGDEHRESAFSALRFAA